MSKPDYLLTLIVLLFLFLFGCASATTVSTVQVNGSAAYGGISDTTSS